MLSRLLATLEASLLPCAVAAAAAQAPAAAVRTEIVRLDIVVTDASGKPVPDLTREDFQVLEDGKPQRITNFLVAGSRRATPSGLTGAEPPPSEADEEPGPGVGRYIAIVVDDLHMAPETADPAKEALRRFVAEQVVPEDSLALVTTSATAGLPSFTRERAAFQQEIRRITSREPGVAAARGAQMTPAQAELILRGDQSALRLATRLLMDEPGSILTRDSPRATVEAADGATPAGLDPEEKAAAREAQREARTVLASALRFSEIALATVDDVLRGLAPLPGRKLCLLVSDGFLVGRGTSEERTERLRQVTDAATRSGAAVYALDARGLTPTGADAAVGGPATDPGLRERVARLTREESRETLQRLADETGGFLVSETSELSAGLARMLADNEAYYLVAYEPSNTKRDGRFRKLEVRLPGHPDFAVRTRKGYLAPSDRKPASQSALRAGARVPPLVASPHTLAATAVQAALSAPLPKDGIPVLVTADYLDLPPQGPQAIVQARVDVAGLRWREAGGHHKIDLEVLGGVYDATGNPVGLPFGRSYELDLGAAEYRRATEEGLRYAYRLPLSPGRYELRIVAREPALDPLGGATQWLEVPDLGEKKLTLSSLFLSTSKSDGPGAAQDGEALQGAQLLRRFKRSDALYFQLYVYNALPDEKGATDVVLQAQIRSGGNAIAASKPQVVTFRQKDGLPLPQSNDVSLESLAPGSYELRVVVVDRKANATAARSVDFTVE